MNQDIVTHTLVSAEGEDPCALKPLPPEERAIDGGQIFLSLMDGKRAFSDLVREYARLYPMDGAKAWLHAHDFLSAHG